MIQPKIHKLAPYAPLDWQLAPLRDKSLIMLMTGAAGGGKSRTAAEKIHAYMLKYPGATGLVVRKAREFVKRSAVPMLWHTVMGGIKSGVQFNKTDLIFYYPNGSTLYAGGMKDEEQSEAIRSIGQEGGLDIVWMEEANAFTEQDYQELLVRMRGNAASWRQIILTTNPDAPSHWINQRLILGRQATVYYSSARDNLYNAPEYLSTLQLLTGTQKDRLVDGLWVLAEGVVFDNFSLELNVSEDAEYNPYLPVKWGVDDGYTLGDGRGTKTYHPRVFLLGQQTAQGGINIFAEYFKCLEQPEISLDNVLALPYTDEEVKANDKLPVYPKPDMAYVDSSAAQLKARIWAKNIQTIGATHAVTEGIKNVRRLIGDNQGVRLLHIHPRCVDLISEFQSYAYGKSIAAVVGERVPDKLNDHGIDATRYMCHPLRF